MKIRIAYFFLFTAVFCCSAQLLSEERTQQQTSVLTVVATENSLPFSFSLPDGTPSGLYVEFWKLWSNTNNIPVRFVLVPFKEGLQLARERNTLHAGLFRNVQREQWADFSLPIHNVQSGFIYNHSINKNTKFSELGGIKVSSQHLSFQESYLRENYPNIEQSTYKTIDEGIKQLLDNDIQAIFAELPNVNAQLAKKGLSGVFTISEEVISKNNVFALIAKGQPELLAKINAGIENIPVNKIIALEKKWLPTLRPYFSDGSSLASLTLAEQKWLQQHPSLSLGVDSGWYPYEYFNDKGDFSGLSSDYISHINNILSIEVKADKSYSWAESLAAIKNNEIDVISAIIRTPEREKSMLFTEPYFSTPTVLVSRKNGFNADSLESLKGRTLGIVATAAVLEFVATDYPEIKIIPVDSTINGVKELNDGKFDAYIGDISIVNYAINKEQLSNLFITGFSPYKLEVSMAVRTELEPLVGILNKVFLNMTEKEKAAIANNWLSIQVKTGTELLTIVLWVLPIVLFLILIILIFVRMNQRLKIEIAGRVLGENNLAKINNELELRVEIRTRELEISENRFNMSQSFGNIGTWDLNLQNGDLYWSDRASALFGGVEGRIETSLDDFMGALHPEDHDSVESALKVCAEGGEIYDIEHRVVWPDGSIHWLHGRGDVVCDDDKNPLNMLGVVRDITFTKDVEAKLVRKERLATIGQLTATVSHELRNPLGAMRPSLYIIKKKSDKDDERLQQAIVRVDRNIDRCDRIIDELLDFTRITELHKNPTLIDEWLESVIDEQLTPEGIQLEKYFTLNGVAIDVDTDRLRRAVINIFDNACHSMMDDNLKLVKNKNALLIIKTSSNENKIGISITDTGSGMSEDVLSKIFEPLYSTKGFGVGLGMPAVKQIMKQHGGYIDIKSNEGKGTTMTLWLPINTQKSGSGSHG